MAYVRTVRTASGARAVQIVHGSRRGARTIEHIGSAHDDLELEALKAAARQRLAGGQVELDLGLETSASAAEVSAAVSAKPLQIASSRMGHLWDGLSSAYDLLGFARAAGGDEVFRQLVLARIIEPTSKQDSLRVLAEVGVDAVSYPTLNRHLRGYAAEGFRRKLAAACAAHAKLGPASLVLYDVSTLYFETDAGDGFREPGFSNYADGPVMPTFLSVGRCSCWSAAGRWRWARHNLDAASWAHSRSRKVMRGSAGRYRPGVVLGCATRARAVSLIVMSAWR